MANDKKSGGMKWVLIVIVLVAAGAGAAWYFNDKADDALEFQTTKVTRGDITQAVTATGTLNPVLNVQVGSQISGIIQKLYADFNSKVKAGDLVAQLDPATYQTRVQQNEGDLASAKAQLELAQVNARRADELLKAKLIPQSDYDQTIASLHQAEAVVQVKQAVLNSSKVDLARCSIYAPIDGIVIDRKVDVGQTVAASMNAPVLFQVANDLTKMQIDANVSEADVGTVEEGQNVNFTVDAFPGRNFIGKVIQIRNVPTTVQNVVTYDCVIEVSNPDMKLKPGMTANVSVVTAERKGVLKIPNGALRFKPPEPSTNKTFAARMLAKIGLGGETKTAATNSAPGTKTGSTNTIDVASAEQPLTGNEPPEELFRRVRAMRERGEEPSPEIGAKLRELFQSGALQRPGGGGGGRRGEGGDRGGRGGGNASARPAAPAVRTIYLMATNTPPVATGQSAAPQAVRVKTGISDGAYTEITDGLKEGDSVITAVKMPASQTAAAPTGTSPFGGGGGGFGRGGR